MTQNPAQTTRLGRPPRITAEQILEVAGTLSAEDLTMPEVAKRLKVRTQSLYHYFQSRDELVARLCEQQAVGFTFDAPRAQQWRPWLGVALRPYRDFLLRHPLQFHVRHATLTAVAALPLGKAITRTLEQAGFELRDAYIHAVCVVTITRQWTQYIHAANQLVDEELEGAMKELMSHVHDPDAIAFIQQLPQFSSEEAFEVAVDDTVGGIPEPEIRHRQS